MASQRYGRVSQEIPLEPSSESINDPLLSVFANGSNDADSDGNDDEWHDDRSTAPSVSVLGNHPSSSGSPEPSTIPNYEENSSSTSSSSSSSSASPSNSPPRTSLWGGLLNAVSRPISNMNSNSVTDGVFGNLIAKEEPYNGTDELGEPQIPDENDDITPEGHPPTYEEASADATPSYWETTIMTYSYGDEIIVGQMPVGSLIIFAWNLLMSSAFSYVGFILTYLFHTTHSAKGGSLVGFGITLIQSSYDMTPVDSTPPGAAPPQLAPLDPNSFDPNAFDEEAQMLYPRPYIDAQPHPKHGNSLWLSNVVFALGILIIIKGFWDYGMALRMESIIINRRREQEHQSEQAQAQAQAEGNTEAQPTPAEP